MSQIEASMARTFPSRVSMEIRRPMGRRSRQRPRTPISVKRVLAAASQWFAMASCLIKDFVALIIFNEQQHRVCPDT